MFDAASRLSSVYSRHIDWLMIILLGLFLIYIFLHTIEAYRIYGGVTSYFAANIGFGIFALASIFFGYYSFGFVIMIFYASAADLRAINMVPGFALIWKKTRDLSNHYLSNSDYLLLNLGYREGKKFPWYEAMALEQAGKDEGLKDYLARERVLFKKTLAGLALKTGLLLLVTNLVGFLAPLYEDGGLAANSPPVIALALLFLLAPQALALFIAYKAFTYIPSYFLKVIYAFPLAARLVPDIKQYRYGNPGPE